VGKPTESSSYTPPSTPYDPAAEPQLRFQKNTSDIHLVLSFNCLAPGNFFALSDFRIFRWLTQTRYGNFPVPSFTLFGKKEKMIDWRISPDFALSKERGWFFPSFEIQEYLLPQINVGKPLIDEYGDTHFKAEDCARLKGNIEYLIDSRILDRKADIQFDAFEKGLVALSCAEIKNCLLKLHEAADEAFKHDATLVFYGD